MRELPKDLIAHGVEVFGTLENFEKWLQSVLLYTDPKKVIELTDEEIEGFLGRIEWGIPS